MAKFEWTFRVRVDVGLIGQGFVPTDDLVCDLLERHCAGSVGVEVGEGIEVATLSAPPPIEIRSALDGPKPPVGSETVRPPQPEAKPAPEGAPPPVDPPGGVAT